MPNQTRQLFNDHFLFELLSWILLLNIVWNEGGPPVFDPIQFKYINESARSDLFFTLVGFEEKVFYLIAEEAFYLKTQLQFLHYFQNLLFGYFWDLRIVVNFFNYSHSLDPLSYLLRHSPIFIN